MDDETQQEGGTCEPGPPAVGPTAAAQDKSPRSSLTGAQTGGLNNPASGGFLFSIDWLAFTIPSCTPEDVQQWLGGEWMEMEKGFSGYSRGWLYLTTGGGSGRMGTGMRKRQGEVHVSLSGAIVSQWEAERIQAICHWVKERQGHGTRIDLALDDRVGHASVTQVIEAADNGQAVMRWSSYDAQRQCSHRGKDDVQGEKICFGSRLSESYLRVYDKRMQAIENGGEIEGPWVRWELELKNERAKLCFELFADLPMDQWKGFTVGLLKSYLAFRETTPDAPSWERCRSPELPWWTALTQGFARSRFHIEKRDRTLDEVLSWFSQAMGPTVAALDRAAGPNWIKEVIRSGSRRWKAHHHQLMQRKTPKRSNPGMDDAVSS